MPEKDHLGEDARQSLERELKEVIEKHFDDFDDGAIYYAMREVFDNKIAEVGIRRASKIQLAAKKVGVAYNTFKKMLKHNR